MTMKQTMKPKSKQPFSSRRLGLVALLIAITVLALVFLAPFYLVIVNSLKDYGAVLRGAASLPRPLVLENYQVAWTTVQFPLAALNSFLITVVSIALLVLVGAMAAWRLARAPHRINKQSLCAPLRTPR